MRALCEDAAMSSATERPTPPPAVSIILPTYNRAAFLPAAFDAIGAQSFTDWELIVVDDGSTDGTEELVRELRQKISRPVVYVRQENQGAYGARNTGLEHARGNFLAFYDSDDVWLPHHLCDCVTALEQHADVDWVYGACQVVNHRSQKITVPNTFYQDGQPRPFVHLHRRCEGDLRIIEDPRVIECAIQYGLFSGLQNSVIRRELFEHRTFDTSFRNEAEDQLVVIRLLANGHKLAYLDRVHVIYHEHESNSSASGSNGQWERHRQVFSDLIRGYEKLLAEFPLSSRAARSVRRRLGREYFWSMGYSLLWQHGQRDEALQMFRRGLRLWPWDWRCWKTYAVSWYRARNAAKRGTSCSNG